MYSFLLIINFNANFYINSNKIHSNNLKQLFKKLRKKQDIND